MNKIIGTISCSVKVCCPAQTTLPILHQFCGVCCLCWHKFAATTHLLCSNQQPSSLPILCYVGPFDFHNHRIAELANKCTVYS